MIEQQQQQKHLNSPPPHQIMEQQSPEKTDSGHRRKRRTNARESSVFENVAFQSGSGTVGYLVQRHKTDWTVWRLRYITFSV